MLANAVRRHLRDFSHNTGFTLQPVFVSRKLERDFRPKEAKPSVEYQQCVVVLFLKCSVRHLFQCVAEHKYSALGKHLTETHGGCDLLNESRFKILYLKKC